jgi:hypothetical protein
LLKIWVMGSFPIWILSLIILQRKSKVLFRLYRRVCKLLLSVRMLL